MLSIPFLLCTTGKYRVAIMGERGVHFDFGFEKGGYYNITLTEVTTTGIALALASTAEFKQLRKSFPSINKICSGKERIAAIQSIFLNQSSNTTSIFNGTIPERDVYTLIYQSCGNIYPYSFLIDINFTNPKSKLDYRWEPLYTESIIFLVFFIILLVVWLFNWVTHWQCNIGLHIFITVSLVLSPILVGTRYAMFMQYRKNDYTNSFSIFVEIINALFRFVLCSIFLLGAKGWCILSHKIRVIEIVRSLAYSAAFIIATSLINNLDVDIWINIVLSLLFVICFVLFLWELLRSITKAQKVIQARSYAIAEAGIDVKTTSFYRKYKIIQTLQISIYIYFLLTFLELAVSIFLSLFWARYLIDDLYNLGALVGLVAIYWLRGGRNEGYMSVGEDDDADFNEEDLQFENTTMAEILNKGGRALEDGEKIPRATGGQGDGGSQQDSTPTIEQNLNSDENKKSEEINGATI